MISKTPYSEMSYPKRILAQGKTTLKLFIDESDLLLGSYYSFFKRGERILMKKSTLKEIGMRKRSKRTSKSGLVKANQDAISIQKQDLPFLEENMDIMLKFIKEPNYICGSRKFQ